MPSIIDGYSYDIFISYRQNDNKYDGWVTEFVDNLTKELESNIKDKISVYFDFNPSDGLLETHSVDRSLEDKLKCLIFIPIISRTYCDCKSFAWQHEFISFNKLALQDRFGRDIRLINGNVASRILPVKIHDIDPDDKILLENEIGGVLRSIEFIYKSAGVNRPLRANEDHPHDNLNKTYYRDQINKVANAIKDIINGLKQKQDYEIIKPSGVTEPVFRSLRNYSKTFIASLILITGICLGTWILNKFVFRKESSVNELEKSIAVLPFINDTPDASEENVPFMNGLMEEIIINLQSIKEFRVPSRTSVEKYRNNSTKSISEIGRELEVNYIVEGSAQRYGSTIRIRVQLIRVKGKEDHIWAKPFEKEIQGPGSLFDLQSQIAQAIADELKVIITPEEKQLIQKIPTNNLDALLCYQNGKEELSRFELKSGVSNDSETTIRNRNALQRAGFQFTKALEYDPEFALPYAALARIYLNGLTKLDSVLILCDKALSIDNKLAEAYILKGYYYWSQGKNNKAIYEFDTALNLNPNSWEANYCRGRIYEAIWNNLNPDNETYEIKSNDLHEGKINKGSELPDLLYELTRVYKYAEFSMMPENRIPNPLKAEDTVEYLSHN